LGRHDGRQDPGVPLQRLHRDTLQRAQCGIGTRATASQSFQLSAPVAYGPAVGLGPLVARG